MSNKEKITQQFLNYFGQTNGKAWAPLITSITESPLVFHFNPFLQHPNFKKAPKDQQAKLSLFVTFKSWSHVKGTAGIFPPHPKLANGLAKKHSLTDKQCEKLKFLTLIGEASKSKVLRLASLKQMLDFKFQNELEDFLIEAINLDLVDGRINSKEDIFRVQWSISRDWVESDIDVMKGQLKALLAKIERVEARSNQVMKEAEEAHQQDIRNKEAIERKRQSVNPVS